MKLFGALFDPIGQWAVKLTSKSEVELAPRFARVGECRQMWSKRFEKQPYPYTSSVGQNIHGTHSHMDRLPEGGFAHTEQFRDNLALSLIQDGEQCDERRHGLAQLQICDMSGKERNNPLCHHANRGGRKHTGTKRKLEIAKVW